MILVLASLAGMIAATLALGRPGPQAEPRPVPVRVRDRREPPTGGR